MNKNELTKVLSSVFVFLGLGGKTREEVLFNVACLAKKLGLINNENILYEELIEKEKSSSTAIGFGVAVPEAYRIARNHSYAFILCRLKNPVDFKSRYKKPVRVILLFLGSRKADLLRFKAILYLSTLLKSAKYRSRLMKAKEANEVYELLKEISGGYEKKLGR